MKRFIKEKNMPLEGEKERKRVERERIGCLVFKLAMVAIQTPAIITPP
jgi:hypothetical protein